MTYRVMFSNDALKDALALPKALRLEMKLGMAKIAGAPHQPPVYRRGTDESERAVDTQNLMVSFLVDRERKELLVSGITTLK